jgi:hypothetical protein
MTHLAARSAAINSSRLGLNSIAELRLGEFRALRLSIEAINGRRPFTCGDGVSIPTLAPCGRLPRP